MNVARSNEELKEKIARPYTRSIPRDHFGALSSEEFANTKDRNAMARNAAKDLGAVLDRFGLLSTTVNTGKYDFANVEYRKLVQEMKVAETEFPAVVASLAAQTEENNRLLNEAEKYKKETVANSDGALNQAKVAADGYLGSKRAEAAGIMARGRNRAEAIRKERESMISSGGQTKIQMQIAQCLRGKPIVPVPICDKNGMQLQTFDLNNFLSTYAVTKAKAAEEK
jgi:regulator of protease activity HflC (stomatin/prohibitin superfamily)